MSDSSPSSKRTIISILAMSFFAAHLGFHLLFGNPANVCWACHVASLSIGIGGILQKRQLIEIGMTWLVVGTPLWIYSLMVGGPFTPTSVLTHLIAPWIGFTLLRSMEPLAGSNGWQSTVGLLLMILLARLATPPQENINLAFRIYGQPETPVIEHAIYLVTLMTVFACISFSSAHFFRKISNTTCDTT